MPPDVLPLPCWTCPSLPLKLEVCPCSQELPDPMWSVRPPSCASFRCPQRLYGCVGQRLRFVSSRGRKQNSGTLGGSRKRTSSLCRKLNALAVVVVSFVLVVDFYPVALIIKRSLDMFASPKGTWIPFTLISASTDLTNREVERRHGRAAQRS